MPVEPANTPDYSSSLSSRLQKRLADYPRANLSVLHVMRSSVRNFDDCYIVVISKSSASRVSKTAAIDMIVDCLQGLGEINDVTAMHHADGEVVFDVTLFYESPYGD